MTTCEEYFKVPRTMRDSFNILFKNNFMPQLKDDHSDVACKKNYEA